MKRSILLLFLFLPFIFADALAQDGYMTPSQNLVDLVDGARNPSVSFSPDRNIMLLQDVPSLPSIEEMAQPQLRLAGIRINPNTNGPSRSGYVTGFTLRDMSTGRDRTISGLPENPVITNVSWSPDGSHIAFLLTKTDRLELWVANVEQARAWRLVNGKVNDTYYGSPMSWTEDGESLLVKFVPEGRGEAPVREMVPEGPVIQENTGGARPARTYQDLLEDTHDEDLFDYYFMAQLAEVNLDGSLKMIGSPAIYRTADLSPDGEYILVNKTERPYSYRVPAYRFPQNIQIWDRDGNMVHQFAELPLADDVPIAFSSTTEGPRSVSWRNDAPATLTWVEALDGGDPSVDVSMRDRIYQHEAPFRGNPTELFEVAYRYAGIMWSEEDFALVSEYWRADRHVRTWKIYPDNPSREAELIFDRSTEDRYGDPGSPEMKRSQYGTWVLHTVDDGNTLLLTGTGATPEGNRPFLRKYNLETGETTELWRSEAPYYEFIVTLLDDEGMQAITRRESVSVQPNYYVRDIESGDLDQITEFEHPTPQLKDVYKEFIQYEREDGVNLSATLYLPPGYDKDRDGPLPVLVWAYPREFRSADAAGQVADSPYRFAGMSYWGPHFALTQGFAVVENATMPIVGEGDANPNDTFVEQLIMSAEAVVNEMDSRGVGDPDRFAIGGHSYGAFMTANLLAHSRIFKAGIARSGAYNRTLTPFGFQAEPRNFWRADHIYLSMSPFMHADGIKDPILFIHGMEDNNSGTFPMQSERMYAAVSGLGGIARLVMLPEESHGYRARESVLHMLYEQSEWLNTYVRGIEQIDDVINR
ncbi:alpha/beta hydrolase family protein [Rhodohalobacter mucosus]|uniref:S9 family peptidase n=1 Tax=Rhodohalobacter mucosus TaxID=2079485 RepID=A0A316U3A2_9BACT|nr:prolyl oligopeptidase family serine peptidase [Rhodohalobacter mucosus]PWN07876.1 S9 family peptidase [Rhodohalobacter mucosus]